MGKKAARLYVDDESGEVTVQVGSTEVARVAVDRSPKVVCEILADSGEEEEDPEEDGENGGEEDAEDDGEEDGDS